VPLFAKFNFFISLVLFVFFLPFSPYLTFAPALLRPFSSLERAMNQKKEVESFAILSPSLLYVSAVQRRLTDKSTSDLKPEGGGRKEKKTFDVDTILPLAF